MNEACSRCPLVIDCISRSSSNAQDVLLYQESLTKIKDFALNSFLESIKETEENDNLRSILEEAIQNSSDLVISKEVDDFKKRLDQLALLRNEFMSDVQNEIKIKEEKIILLQDEKEFYDQLVQRLIDNCQKGPRFFGKKCRSDLISPK